MISYANGIQMETRVNTQTLELLQAPNTLEQLSRMFARNLNFSQILPNPL